MRDRLITGNSSSTPPINMNYIRNDLTVTLSWNHSQPDVVQRFEIMLDNNLHAIATGSQKKLDIQLPACRKYVLHIVAVDYCDSRNASEFINITCFLEISTSPTTADPGEHYEYTSFSCICSIKEP